MMYFQHHNGTIQTRLYNRMIQIIDVFQHLEGTIQTRRDQPVSGTAPGLSTPQRYDSSGRVQRQYETRSRDFLQHHKGTIQTVRLERIQLVGERLSTPQREDSDESPSMSPCSRAGFQHRKGTIQAHWYACGLRAIEHFQHHSGTI